MRASLPSKQNQIKTLQGRKLTPIPLMNPDAKILSKNISKTRGSPGGPGNKCSGLVHWEDPEESGGEGGGRGDRDGKYM